MGNLAPSSTLLGLWQKAFLHDNGPGLPRQGANRSLSVRIQTTLSQSVRAQFNRSMIKRAGVPAAHTEK